MVSMRSKGRTGLLLVRGASLYSTIKIRVVIPQLARHRSTPRPNYTTLGHRPTEYFILLQRHMFIAAAFTIAKNWKVPRCLSTEECIRKMWDIYTMILGSKKLKS